MAKKPKAKRRKSAKSLNKLRKRQKLERKLEEGLRETFPASDPPAITDPVRGIKE